jgi:WD40 repeat protein
MLLGEQGPCLTVVRAELPYHTVFPLTPHDLFLTIQLCIHSLTVSEGDAYEDTLVVTGCEAGVVKAFVLKTAKLRFTLTGHEAGIVSVAFISGKEGRPLICSIDKNNQIRIWCKAEGKCLRVI